MNPRAITPWPITLLFTDIARKLGVDLILDIENHTTSPGVETYDRRQAEK
jgi:hypothetical protein